MYPEENAFEKKTSVPKGKKVQSEVKTTVENDFCT